MAEPQHPLSPKGHTLVVLDACVLLPSRLSDVLFDLMLTKLYSAYWSPQVATEFLRNWPAVHPDAPVAGAERLLAFEQAARHGHLVFGYDAPSVLARVPKAVHANDQHLVAAALVLMDAGSEEAHPEHHKVILVSHNTRHLAASAVKKLGIEVLKPGVFLDRVFAAAPERSRNALAKAISDLKNPPYTHQEMASALRLHGVKSPLIDE